MVHEAGQVRQEAGPVIRARGIVLANGVQSRSPAICYGRDRVSGAAGEGGRGWGGRALVGGERADPRATNRPFPQRQRAAPFHVHGRGEHSGVNARTESETMVHGTRFWPRFADYKLAIQPPAPAAPHTLSNAVFLVGSCFGCLGRLCC